MEDVACRSIPRTFLTPVNPGPFSTHEVGLMAESVPFRTREQDGMVSAFPRPNYSAIIGISFFLSAFHPNHAQEHRDIFNETNLIQIRITVPAAGMRSLRTYNWDARNPNVI